MRFQSIIKYVSRFLEPTRVFIALMLAVGVWLFPFISFKEKTITPIEHGVIVSADPFTAGAIGECADVHCEPGYCCVKGYCKTGQDNCGSDDPPPSPPTISANLNCSNWGDNGWCKGSLSIDLSAADPQGQAVVISGAVNGNNFACPSGATSCSIPLSGEGTGSVSYQVNSATGLSAAGSLGYQIDLTSPDLDTSVSGAAGTNGWYRSDVTLGVSASDATSGIASITASINGGGATSVGGSLTFSDGEYSVLIIAKDNAGHVTQDTQIIKVDTITPSLSFTSSGTNGKNGWYVSSASAAATASDSGSGLASIEASVDGGGWIASDSISLSDGVHTYQFRATDVAGNTTETPTQTAMIDTIAPSISMSQGTNLGEKVLYEIEDYGSGLSIFRAVIEDDDEAYQKVTWSGDISGSYIADEILWDGKFADGTKAGIGEYMVTLKITDAAGNKAMKTTFVTVGLLDLLDDIPAFAPPVSSTSAEDEIPTTASTTGPQTFGGIPTTTDAGEFISTTSTVSGITIPTTNIPIDPNILWGAAATAMVGATLADWQKKREEEARRKAEAQEEKRANTEKRWGLKKQEDAVRQRWAVEKAAEEMAQSRTADSLRWAGLASVAQAQQAAQQAQDKAAFDHRMDEHTGEQDKFDAWKAQQADAARWAGLAAMEQAKQEETKPTIWDKAWDLAYNNQLELSLGTGLLVGTAAALAVAASIITAPAWLVIGGAVLVTGAIVTAGTMLLNSHFELDWNQNLASNLIAGVAATIITTGAGLLLVHAAPLISTTVANTCMSYPEVCKQIGPILDKGEEALLAAQLTYYNWTDDQDNAALAAMELQLELMDGGVPGNSITAEISEQLVKLGPDAAELIGRHGNGIIPLLLTYGDDAVDIIGAYGDEGISLLTLHGKDAVKLIKEYGTPGVKILGTVNLKDANKLLSNLDPKAIKDLVELDAKTITALSKLPADVLLESGTDAVYIAGVYGDEGLSLLTLFGNDAASLITEYGTPAVGLLTTHGDEVIEVYQNGHLAEASLAEIIPEARYDEVVKAFKENTASAVTLDKDLTVYRYWSGDISNEVGRWTSVNSTMTPEEARSLLALPKSNLATTVTEFTIPKGTTIVFGEASSQTTAGWAGSYATGGALQIYIADPGVLVKTP